MSWRRVAALGGAVAAAYLAGAVALARYGRRAPSEGRFDAIVVLGCRVRPDSSASPALRRRARRAAALYRDGRAPLVVLTGGVGDHAPSEARAAAEIAWGAGVPRSAMVLEERSTSTLENASEAAMVLRARAPEARRVLLVTDDYHRLRAERVFRRHFSHVGSAGTSGAFDVRARGALREVAAVAAYVALGRMRS